MQKLKKTPWKWSSSVKIKPWHWDSRSKGLQTEAVFYLQNPTNIWTQSLRCRTIALRTSTSKAADARQTQTRSGQTALLPSEQRPSGAPLRWSSGAPSALLLPLSPFLSGFICSVRARSISRPGEGIHWLRHRRRISLRLPMDTPPPGPAPSACGARARGQVSHGLAPDVVVNPTALIPGILKNGVNSTWP